MELEVEIKRYTRLIPIISTLYKFIPIYVELTVTIPDHDCWSLNYLLAVNDVIPHLTCRPNPVFGWSWPSVIL